MGFVLKKDIIGDFMETSVSKNACTFAVEILIVLIKKQEEFKMTYSIILFAVLFVVTAIVHKPLNAHETKKKWLKTAHYWLEHLVVIQAMIIMSKLLDLL
jgi:hypothetical protein